MSAELWIVLLLVASAVSAWIGFAYARRSGPSPADVEALESALDEARAQAEGVQANVNEHFEQSALLFGRLAKDYREFLDHFSASAQALGLSESRARELIEQGFQPVLTHDSVPEVARSEAEEAPPAFVHGAEADAPESELRVVGGAEPGQTEPEAPLVDDIVVLEAGPAEAVGETPGAAGSDVVVEMPDSEATGRTDPDGKRAKP